MTHRSFAAAGLLVLFAAACADESLVLPGSGTPSALVAVGGDNQSARVGEMLPSPLVVEVRDADGNGVAGVRVRWSAEGGGTVSSPEGETDTGGRATVQRRLGSEPGVQRTIAVLDMDEGVRETFTASAVPEGAPRLSIAEEPPETATEGRELSRAPVVQLQSDDGDELREEGVPVTVTIAGGSGDLDGTRTRETDDDGRASFPGLVISGGAGSRKLIFAAEGYTSVTSRSIEVREPPSPGSIKLERGNNQTAHLLAAVAVDPAVKVLDASGNPKPGVTVTFEVVSGGGRVSGGSATSNSDGIATVGEWRLGDQPGTNTLRAAASGYSGSPLTFTATAVEPPPPPPAPAKALEFADQPRDTEESETMAAVRVRIVDDEGKVVGSASHTVKLELIRVWGLGTLNGNAERAAVNGVATFDNLKVNRTGWYRLRATAAGLEAATSREFRIEDD